MLFNRRGPRGPKFKLFALSLCMFCGGSLQAVAEENFYSFTFQNDAFFNREGNGYTNGFFLARTRLPSKGEDGTAVPLMLSPAANWLGMPKATLASTTLSQIMITPRDIERPVPRPRDVPYAGVLNLRSTGVFVHDEIADMMTLNLGAMGPASGADKMQRFLHRVRGATKPEGWNSQGSSKLLVGLEGYRSWRRPWGSVDAGQSVGDFVVTGGGALGNRESLVGGTLMVRYGTDLQQSFPTLSRVNGRSGDPFAIGRSWFAYAGLSGDRILGDRGIGSSTPGNTTQLRKSQITPVLGFAYGWGDSSLTFSLQSATPLVDSNHDRQSYGSVTYVWHPR